MKRPSSLLAGISAEADDGGRTRDLRLGKPALCQLSYVRATVNLPRRERRCKARLPMRMHTANASKNGEPKELIAGYRLGPL